MYIDIHLEGCNCLFSNFAPTTLNLQAFPCVSHVAPWPKHPSDPGDVQFVHPGMHGHVRAPLSPSLGLPAIDQAPVGSPSFGFCHKVMDRDGVGWKGNLWGNHRNQSGKRNQIIKSQRRCVSCISITPIKNMFWSFLYQCHPIPSHVIQFWGIVWTCFCPSFHKRLWWMGEHGQLQKRHGMDFAPADGHHRLLTCKCSKKKCTFDLRSRLINERSSIHKDNKSSSVRGITCQLFWTKQCFP